MKYKFSVIVLTIVFICCCSCKKTPQKGEYKGVFIGKYKMEIYTSDYYFDITHSTKKELKLMEKQSKVNSTLNKHENDSISGGIGFGRIGGIYKPKGSSSPLFNVITIVGKYNKDSITGTFTTTFEDGDNEYLSVGTFVISHY